MTSNPKDIYGDGHGFVAVPKTKPSSVDSFKVTGENHWIFDLSGGHSPLAERQLHSISVELIGEGDDLFLRVTPRALGKSIQIVVGVGGTAYISLEKKNG